MYPGIPITVTFMHPAECITYGMGIDTPTGLSMYLGMPITVTFMPPAGCITYGMGIDTPIGLSMFRDMPITVTPMHPAILNCIMGISASMDMLTIPQKAMFPIMRRAIMPVWQHIIGSATSSPGPNTLL